MCFLFSVILKVIKDDLLINISNKITLNDSYFKSKVTGSYLWRKKKNYNFIVVGERNRRITMKLFFFFRSLKYFIRKMLFNKTLSL